MATLVEAMTLEQFAALPEPADGSTLELIDGEVRCMSGGSLPHGVLIGELLFALAQFVRAQGLGRVVNNMNFEFVLERGWSPVPDVAFIKADRLSRASKESVLFQGAPDLAVEVTSPSNSDNEIASKTDAYLRAGSSRVWVVRPELKTITVVRPDRSAKTFVAGEMLSSNDAGFDVEGFELSLSELFAIAD